VRTPSRINQRNGYRQRNWETRVGAVPVAIPKLRKGVYFPAFLEPRLAAEKALIAVIQEAYVQGVDALGGRPDQGDEHDRYLQEPGLTVVERVRAVLERPIEGSWPYLWIDASYGKVRKSGRIVSVRAT
jgi:transposase-like protein